jgi:hypothetical protein
LTNQNYAQNSSVPCSFIPSAADLAQYNAIMDQLNSGNMPETLADIPLNASIPIYFWVNNPILVHSQDAFTLSRSVERANAFFHFPNNARLTFCGVSYINDPQYYSIPNGSSLVPMFNTYNKAHAINVYLTAGATGATTLGDNSDRIIMGGVGTDGGTDADIKSDLIFAHELGHVFGLFHTFNDINPAVSELVIRDAVQGQIPPNWRQAADKMRSTPANLYALGTRCHSSCPYECPYTTDANGDSYAPDIGNLMSYHYCYNSSTMHFTEEQQTKMTLTLQIERAFLINAPCSEDIANFGRLYRPRYANNQTDECYSSGNDLAILAKNANVSIQSNSTGAPLCANITSDIDGYYKSCNFPTNSPVTITPTKNTNYLEGVSTLDIALISRHILGIIPFEFPYQMLAADVDNSGDIDGTDMLIIRRLILGIYSVFPNNVGSWRFVPNYFLNQPSFASTFKTDPFSASFQGNCYSSSSCGNSYMDKVTLDMTSDEAKKFASWSFEPFKVGDVNYCSTTYSGIVGPGSPSDPSSARVANNNYQLRTARTMTMRRTEEKTIVLKAKSTASVMAMQIGLRFLKDKFKIKEIEKGDFESANDVFDFNKEDKGELRALWFNKRGQTKNIRVGTVLLKAKVKADANIDDILNVLNLDDQILKTEFYDASGNLVPMDLEWDDDNDNGNSTGDSNILVNAFPNPFRNEVSLEINSPVAESATITISNIITGQSIVLQRQLVRGANVINVNNTSSLSPGMLTYSIVIGRRIVNGTITKAR